MDTVSKVGANEATSSPRKKSGGRKKGTPNTVTAEIRNKVRAADPIDFLIQTMKGAIPTYDIDGTPTGAFDSPRAADRVKAAEFLAKRISPEMKETPFSLSIPTITDPQEAVKALAGVANALAVGDVLPNEAKALSGSLSAYLKAYDDNEIVKRLEALERLIEQRAS